MEGDGFGSSRSQTALASIICCQPITDLHFMTWGSDVAQIQGGPSSMRATQIPRHVLESRYMTPCPHDEYRNVIMIQYLRALREDDNDDSVRYRQQSRGK